MLAGETLIAWNDLGDNCENAPAGSVAVGPWMDGTQPHWTEAYSNIGGAAEIVRRSMSPREQILAIMQDFYRLVYLGGLHPYVVHRAFLHIDEYQLYIKEMGAGPAPGELGHDPEIPYGRAADYPVPVVAESKVGGSVHVWPVTTV